MANLGVIQSFTGPDGRQILSIRPDAFQTAVKAAMATPDGAETALRAGIAQPDIMDRPQSDPLLGKLVTLIENADPAAQRRLLDLLEGQAVKLHDLLTNPPETHEPGHVRKR